MINHDKKEYYQIDICKAFLQNKLVDAPDQSNSSEFMLLNNEENY